MNVRVITVCGRVCVFLLLLAVYLAARQVVYRLGHTMVGQKIGQKRRKAHSCTRAIGKKPTQTDILSVRTTV